MNQVYADTDGSIGWIAAGFSPIRPNWDGLLPVPGDGRYEWQGFHRAGGLPHCLNPESGFVATANEQNVPSDWPLPAEKIGHEWIDTARARRIAEVFASTPVHTVASSCALQTDVMSLPARRLLHLLAGLQGDGPEAAAALRLFAGWDAVLTAESAAAALFEVWWSKHLRPGLFAVSVADPALRALLAPGDADTVLARLEEPEAWFAAPAMASRDRLLLETLAQAYDECSERMGKDPSSWAWGRLHQAYFEHALTGLRQDTGLDVGPLPIGGSDGTPMNATYRFDDLRVVLGASFRMVVDVGDWDRSVCINAPGQSGDPRSPHYRDLAQGWSHGDYVPLLYGQEAVDEATEQRITLRPLGSPAEGDG